VHLSLPFIVEWPDRFDYYLIRFGPIMQLRQLTSQLTDRGYDRHGFALAVRMQNLTILGFFGRPEFFNQLPDPGVGPCF
jgi:hypothetical protein